MALRTLLAVTASQDLSTGGAVRGTGMFGALPTSLPLGERGVAGRYKSLLIATPLSVLI